MRPKTSQNRKSLNKHTLSPSITFVNSVFQNLIASSSVKPIPFKKRPYCCLPWWRRWSLARMFWWRCCMHSGKSFFANCIDGKSNIVLSFFFSVYNYFYSTFLNLSKTVLYSSKDITRIIFIWFPFLRNIECSNVRDAIYPINHVCSNFTSSNLFRVVILSQIPLAKII